MLALFLWTAPNKHILTNTLTHTHSLSGRYLKSHCAYKDKPEQPEQYKATDKVHSLKPATVEIEFTLKKKYIPMELIIASGCLLISAFRKTLTVSTLCKSKKSKSC